MGQLLLLLVSALVIAAIGFGVVVLVTGSDPGLSSNEPDGRAVPLPGTRPLVEADVAGLRFDTAIRGYRMSQVDAALRRAAYDVGYKEELIAVLTAETDALRAGRLADADALFEAREAALEATRSRAPDHGPAIVVPSEAELEPVDIDLDREADDFDRSEAFQAVVTAPEAADVEPVEVESVDVEPVDVEPVEAAKPVEVEPAVEAVTAQEADEAAETRSDEPVDGNEPVELVEAAKPVKKARPAKRQSTGLR